MADTRDQPRAIRLYQYDSGYDTLREDIFFAANGYVTIAPDYRNYAGSDKGEYQLAPGYAYDVRNLLDALRFVAPVDAARIGMMGHSMGGGITQEVLVSTPGQVRAATLYGSVSGDEVDNYIAEHHYGRAQVVPTRKSEGDRVTDMYGPPDDNRRSVLPHVPDQLPRPDRLPRRHPSQRIRPDLPLRLGGKITRRLRRQRQARRFLTYQSQPHSFQGAGFQQYLDTNLAFFDTHVKDA